MSGERIAIVGIGLRYPDASTPVQLWENVLAGRRAFRRLPQERMNSADYYSADPAAPDRFYSSRAAVLRDFEFDRVRYQVAGSTYRATDLTHWLALDTAARALDDAGFPGAADLPGPRTGVVIGNSLTGEFARANLMRLRWPYVRRTLAAALTEKGWQDSEIAEFLRDFEPRYKEPFPAIDEDTLAGGLANTIAGRICNHFDLGGGGYTVDGACSSSLLSVATAATALSGGNLDVAIAGGVDLSIDPFEVIGFAKTGALATGEMKVYDKGSNGFWPGEGCGMLVLMREEDAIARGARIYACVSGWGISSDGRGGITRPEAVGHRLALSRAYERAGYGVETVSYFEGHGTGTAIGDATEIQALTETRRAANAEAPAALSTIKGNIGHTKAAAGVAGLIKATLAVHHQVIPPATGHHDPHPALCDGEETLYVPARAQPWPADGPLRAGVSALGFGGINTHIALEQAAGERRRTEVDDSITDLVRGRQDAELLLFDGKDDDEVRAKLERAAARVPRLAEAELTDLAAELAGALSGGPVRAAAVVSTVDQAEHRLARLLELLADGAEAVEDGVFLARRTSAPRVSFLFPGQGSGRGVIGAIRHRFAEAESAFAEANLPTGGDQTATEVAQPRIVTGSIAGLRVLSRLGLTADRAAGHSLGELTALHWAGALDEAGLRSLAATRGQVMAEASQGGGGMAGLSEAPERVRELIDGTDVVIAGYNGPRQTVISGRAADVDDVCERAKSDGVNAVRINVSHAFHSPLVGPAARVMADRLSEVDFQNPGGTVLSTVTGKELAAGTDLRSLLVDQILEPVRFQEAASAAVTGADLVVEVGPGRVLTGLLGEIAPDVPTLALDTDATSLAPVLSVAGAAFALGASVNVPALFDGRLVRPLPEDGDMSFLASPCEAAPTLDGEVIEVATAAAEEAIVDSDSDESTMELLRRLAAERAELPLESINDDTHPLDDLHLSSITVAQLVNEATRARGVEAPTDTPNYATARLGELASLIDELAPGSQPDDQRAGEVEGLDTWVRPLVLTHVPAPPAPKPEKSDSTANWTHFAPDDHPFATPLHAALSGAGIGDGVLLCLPDDGTGEVDRMLEAAKAAVSSVDGTRFVVVHNRFGAAGLARTLHLEAPQVKTTVITGTPDIEAVVADVAATTGFAEVHYAADGARTKPVLRPMMLPEQAGAGSPLGSKDVLLVTGGGKGITAECALAMAQDSGAGLALLGRADPGSDKELAGNLDRMRAAGVRFSYAAADVTDPERTAAAVESLQAELGQVTAVLHGAGRNEPSALANLSAEQFRQTLAPKIDGLRSVLDAVDPDRIKLLITFGSIIGRAGLRGEGHYATANDWLTELTVRFGEDHPQARALALEWSVWSGAGMGERLGVVEALSREGITPISPEQGIAVLREILADPDAGPVLVISGRSGGLSPMDIEREELPVRRFLDRVLVHYPMVELITEVDLAEGSDPYLSDHLLDGDLLFPAVLGMEAMAQVAAAVTGWTDVPTLRDMEFQRPIVVRPGESTTVRIAALVRDAGTVEVAIRSAETGFGADHFRATLCRPGRPATEPDTPPAADLPPVPLDPIGELYGGILFQGKRFQRLLGYRKSSARHAIAEISTGATAPWFAPFLAQDQVLADPGARDAVMHALQCCVPDATLLPQRLERLYPRTANSGDDHDYLVMDAHERSQDGDTYTYDIEVRTPAGEPVERWEGLSLRAVRKRDGAGPWAPVLLGSLVERGLERVLGDNRPVIIEPAPATNGGRNPGDRTELAVRRALDEPNRLHLRPDGTADVDGRPVSVAHDADLTMFVLGAPGAAVVSADCDADWVGRLGHDGQALAKAMAADGDPEPVANARVRAAQVCLRASGTAGGLTNGEAEQSGWRVLNASGGKVATWATEVPNRPNPVVFAVLAETR